MKVNLLLLAIITTTLAYTVPAFGQWPLHMEGVPLLYDGSPDLAAPSPMTLDGYRLYFAINMVTYFVTPYKCNHY